MDWISVNVKQPEESGRYLVVVDVPFFNARVIDVARYSKRCAGSEMSYHGMGLWHFTDVLNRDVVLPHVTHWMQLPEPPKED